jgi:VWFA-related protein
MSGSRAAISLVFCLLLFAADTKAQDSQQAPPNSVTTEDARNAEPESYQLKVQVRRVVLDVVVTDAKGNPVGGLEQGDFNVMEDGVVQPLRFFDVHTGTAPGPSQQPLDLHLPPDTFSNLTLAPPDRPVTVLLYDMLDTPPESFASAHQALVKFIKDQKSSTRIAIFVLTDRLHMLQGFTDDETRLMQAVNSKAATTQATPLRNAPFAQDALVDRYLRAAELDEALDLGRKRRRLTMEAFSEIARFVSALPGRKNLIWMSGSFPASIFTGPTHLDPDARVARRLLEESRVAIYPVDVRGLRVDPELSAATQTIQGSIDLGSFGLIQEIGHAGMGVIADATGGKAFYNTNGLREAMDAAVRQGSQYYTLTYAPTNTRADGGERSIKVVLKHPGYRLSYRRSYFAEDAGRPDVPTPLALDMSMRHGAPNSSGLFLEAKVSPLDSATVPSIEEAKSIEEARSAQASLQASVIGPRPNTQNGPGSGQHPLPSLIRRDTMRVRHYEIDLAMIGRQLEMPVTQSGQYASNMRFALAAYASDGTLLNGSEVRIRRSISEIEYRKIGSEGYHTSMLFIVPEGTTSLRMAVRDEIGERLGTLEIPTPLPATQSASNCDNP